MKWAARPIAVTLVATFAILSCSIGTEAAGSKRRGSSGSAGSTGCGRLPVAAGVTERTMQSGGIERQFQLTVPDGYDGRKPMPIVLGLHPLSVPHGIAASMIGFADASSRFAFIGVSPSGRLNGAIPFWLAAPTQGNEDVRFIRELLDLLEVELCVDRARVYATGMSNGGQMSSLLACRLSKRIAAVAPVAGVEFPRSCRGRPVPVIAFHGTADPIVTYVGGGLNAAYIADANLWMGRVPQGLPRHRGVDAAMRTWASHNGCEDGPREERIASEVRRRTWKGCRAPTILYVIDGGGHAWPGKPVPQFESSFGHATTQIDASALIFDFFAAHPRRGSR